MTTEQKVKAYDNAFNVALETYKTQPMYRDWLEKMFPELKESGNERIRKEIIDFFEHYPNIIVKKERRYDWIAWLEKQGKKGTNGNERKIPFLAWSEEDEVKINRIVACLENLNVVDYDILLKDVDWLKSLRPQSTWKPSDEQVKAFNYVINLMASSESPKENDYYYNVFKGLREQLMKLRGE